jgi:hypothetical protein
MQNRKFGPYLAMINRMLIPSAEPSKTIQRPEPTRATHYLELLLAFSSFDGVLWREALMLRDNVVEGAAEWHLLTRRSH